MVAAHTCGTTPAVTLHATWRGLYAFGTDTTDRKIDEHTAEWPATNRRAYFGPAPLADWKWYRQLVSAGTDESGLMFRRNRFYDPASGQFTQADLIGIAGGLNVYGYADGDPENLESDPVGSPVTPELDPRQGRSTPVSGFCQKNSTLGRGVRIPLGEG